jgi:hypothetical protein
MMGYMQIFLFIHFGGINVWTWIILASQVPYHLIHSASPTFLNMCELGKTAKEPYLKYIQNDVSGKRT